jgi:hypothetical protein
MRLAKLQSGYRRLGRRGAAFSASSGKWSIPNLPDDIVLEILFWLEPHPSVHIARLAMTVSMFAGLLMSLRIVLTPSLVQGNVHFSRTTLICHRRPTNT